jgi:hypothetical protein
MGNPPEAPDRAPGRPRRVDKAMIAYIYHTRVQAYGTEGRLGFVAVIA